MNSCSVSIVVPAYNEEKNLENTIREVMSAIETVTNDYEFVIIDDCSTDNTPKITERLVATNPHVRVHRNETNRGIGYGYRKGVELARKQYVMLVPGDNELKPDSVRVILEQAGKADLIIPWPSNMHVRPIIRQLASKGFTSIVNFLCHRKVRYYNGSVLQKRELLQGLSFETERFAFQVEILLQLLDKGCTYYEVPTELNYGSKRVSALFLPKNVKEVVHELFRIFLRYRIGSKENSASAATDLSSPNQATVKELKRKRA